MPIEDCLLCIQNKTCCWDQMHEGLPREKELLCWPSADIAYIFLSRTEDFRFFFSFLFVLSRISLTHSLSNPSLSSLSHFPQVYLSIPLSTLNFSVFCSTETPTFFPPFFPGLLFLPPRVFFAPLLTHSFINLLLRIYAERTALIF